MPLLGLVAKGSGMHGRITPSAGNGSGHRERLRRRLFDGGGKALLDHELVEYLLALAIPRRDTKDQAKELIAKFGGDSLVEMKARFELFEKMARER